MKEVTNMQDELKIQQRFFIGRINDDPIVELFDSLDSRIKTEENKNFLKYCEKHIQEYFDKVSDPCMYMNKYRMRYFTSKHEFLENFHLDFKNIHTNKVIHLRKNSYCLMCFSADLDNKKLELIDPNKAFPVYRSTVKDCTKDGSIITDNRVCLSKDKKFYDSVKNINHGFAIIAFLKVNSSNSDLTCKEDPNLKIRKWFNLFTTMEYVSHSTKAYLDIFLIQWKLDEDGENIYEYEDPYEEDSVCEEKPPSGKKLSDIDIEALYEPIFTPDPEQIMNTYYNIIKTGKGELNFKITGVLNDNTKEDINESKN